MNNNSPTKRDYKRQRFQFRMTTFLVLLSIASLLIFAWAQLVVPNVAGLSMDGNRLVIHLTDNAGREMVSDTLSDDEYFSTLADSDDVLFHDAYVSFPLIYLALGVAASVTLGLGGYLGVRRFKRPSANPT